MLPSLNKVIIIIIITGVTLNAPPPFFFRQKQEMSLKKTNGVGLKKEENITQARLSTCS